MYQDWKNALQTLLQAEVAELKEIDWDNEQWLNTEREKATDYPACYIKFANPINWQTKADGLKTAGSTIALTVVGNTLEDSPADIMEVASKVQKALHLKPLRKDDVTIASKLMLSSSTLNTRRRQLKVIGLTFSTELYDYSTLKQRVSVSPTLVLQEKED